MLPNRGLLPTSGLRRFASPKSACRWRLIAARSSGGLRRRRLHPRRLDDRLDDHLGLVHRAPAVPDERHPGLAGDHALDFAVDLAVVELDHDECLGLLRELAHARFGEGPDHLGAEEAGFDALLARGFDGGVGARAR